MVSFQRTNALVELLKMSMSLSGKGEGNSAQMEEH